MNNRDAQQFPARPRFIGNALELALRHAREVLQRHGDQPVAEIIRTHQAGKTDDSTSLGTKLCDLNSRIEIIRLNADIFHPPVTGGKKATSSSWPITAPSRACS